MMNILGIFFSLTFVDVVIFVSEQGALVGSYKGTCRFYETSGMLFHTFSCVCSQRMILNICLEILDSSA